MTSRPLRHWLTCLGLALGSLLLAGCGGNAVAADTPAPLTDVDNAYEAAERLKLEVVAPTDHDDLHNVYWLSETIISGGEPLTPEAMKRVADMGVKTILSVDGKTPDLEVAEKHGIRYVHVPIRYSGVTRDQLMKIAKTFRELEPPFYVHCFHGKHRGPAAAAVGRLVLDGCSREQALAEMRQWSGTSKKYEALYRVIAVDPMPTKAETEAFDFGFDPAHEIGGVRGGMVLLTRTFDNVKMLQKNGWKPDPAHPDIDPANEAKILYQFFASLDEHEDTLGRPDDYRVWMTDSVREAKALAEALAAAKDGTDGATAAADKHFAVVKQLCAECHKPYRN